MARENFSIYLTRKQVRHPQPNTNFGNGRFAYENPAISIVNMKPQTSTVLSQPYELLVQDAVVADADAIGKIGVATFKLPYGHSMVQAYLDNAYIYTLSAISKDLATNQNHYFLIARLNSALSAENRKAVGFIIQMKLGTTEPCYPPPMCQCANCTGSTSLRITLEEVQTSG